jgi:hypothetical protein
MNLTALLVAACAFFAAVNASDSKKKAKPQPITIAPDTPCPTIVHGRRQILANPLFTGLWAEKKEGEEKR